MTAEQGMAAAAAVVAVAFALCLTERWIVRRRPHELAWATALYLFAAGALSLWAGAALGWDGWSFRLFYAFGAVLNVPFLALGTVYLLAGPRIGHRVAAGVAAFAAFAAGVVLSAPFTAPVAGAALPQGSDVFGPGPRILAAAASAGGALVVFGGAAWSAARLVRGRGPRRLAVGNLVLTAGTLVLSGSGLLNSVRDQMEAFAATLAVGVTILFAGFMVMTTQAARAPLRAVDDRAA
ncbi:MAG: hypothetical protein JF603_14330 [Acidobacteria bacterium]|nr:hypothetical protein [Acidobacteriota bacterium]